MMLWRLQDTVLCGVCSETLQDLGSPFSLIRVIVTLLHRAWVVDISWMPQGGNDPVNWLAKKALRSSCQPLILDFPLPDLLPLLSADMNGASLEQDHRVNLIVVNSEG
ncbi:hypothetical protein V6N13_042292 [Hibiscus sabdariffa]